MSTPTTDTTPTSPTDPRWLSVYAEASRRRRARGWRRRRHDEARPSAWTRHRLLIGFCLIGLIGTVVATLVP